MRVLYDGRKKRNIDLHDPTIVEHVLVYHLKREVNEANHGLTAWLVYTALAQTQTTHGLPGNSQTVKKG